MRQQVVHALAMVAIASLAIMIIAGLTMAVPAAGTAGKSGSLTGRLVLDLPEVRLADLGPMVAYLAPDHPEHAFPVPPEVLRISQQNANFQPNFMTVVAGQTVEMPNDDTIVHNVFSISPGNSFDLGLYPKGISQSVTFREPGVVRVYCSIHATMSATIFVAPSPYHARLAKDGSFELSGVPPGAYRLRVWSRKLPEIMREIEITAGQQTIELRLGIEPQTRARDGSAKY